jgi:hypothetical protein
MVFNRTCAVMQDLADSVSDMSKANDWFLVAPDFTDYMRAQVRFPQCNTILMQPSAAPLEVSASSTVQYLSIPSFLLW